MSHLNLAFNFSLMILFPGLLMALNLTDSSFIGMSISVSFAALSIFIFHRNNALNIRTVILLSLLPIIITLHLTMIYLFVESNLNWDKAIFSLVIFMVMLIVGDSLSFKLKNIAEQDFDRIILRLFWFLVLVGFLFSIMYRYDLLHRKMLLFFYEPSHYALVFSPFIFYFFSSSNKKINKFVVFVALLTLSAILMNMVFVVALLISLFISAKDIKFKLLSVVAIFSIGLYFLYYSDSNFASYLLDRLVLSSKSDNLTVKVFLSGWERAFLAITDSYGLGYGFQQMGHIGPTGYLQKTLGQLNIADGSFLFSKLTFEFGLLGILLVILYISKLLTIVHKHPHIKSNKIRFFNSVYISFFLYLFVRGGGYFMPTVFMFIMWLNSTITTQPYFLHPKIKAISR